MHDFKPDSSSQLDSHLAVAIAAASMAAVTSLPRFYMHGSSYDYDVESLTSRCQDRHFPGQQFMTLVLPFSLCRARVVSYVDEFMSKMLTH